MSRLTGIQFEVLFNNVFGEQAQSMGVQTDESGPSAVGLVNGHVLSLFVVQGRALEWQLDGEPFLAFATLTPDSPERAANGTALGAAVANSA